MILYPNSKFESKPISKISLVNPRIDKKEISDSELVTFVPMAAVTEKINSIKLDEKRKFKEVAKGYTPFLAGDILFAKVTPCMENGKVALVPKLPTDYGFGSTEFHVFRSTKEVHPKYLYYFLSSDQFRDEAQQRMTGAVGLRRVPTSFFDVAELPLPDFETQIEIVEKIEAHFSEIDKSIQELQSAKNNLELYRQSILNAAIRGKLLPQDPKDEPASVLLEKIQQEKEKLITAKKIKKEKPLPPITEDEIPFELPQGWIWTRLGNLGNFERGKSKHRPRNDKRLFDNGRYPFVQTGDIASAKETDYRINNFSKKYSEFGLKQSKLWPKDTLCITIAANIADLGFLNFEACFPDSVVAFVSPSNMIKNYVFTYTMATRDQIESFAPATAQKNINLGILNELIVPVPPEKEMGRIFSKTDVLLNEGRKLAVAIDENTKSVEMLKQSILKKAFEGRL